MIAFSASSFEEGPRLGVFFRCFLFWPFLLNIWLSQKHQVEVPPKASQNPQRKKQSRNLFHIYWHVWSGVKKNLKKMLILGFEWGVYCTFFHFLKRYAADRLAAATHITCSNSYSCLASGHGVVKRAYFLIFIQNSSRQAEVILKFRSFSYHNSLAKYSPPISLNHPEVVLKLVWHFAKSASLI